MGGGGKDGIPERVGIWGEKNEGGSRAGYPKGSAYWVRRMWGGVKGGIPERVGIWGEKDAGKHSVVADMWGLILCNGLFAVFVGACWHMKKSPPEHMVW